ncbi:histidine kinase N-terminal 7TM domain-containing diguanylate cyclase [Cohnella caldifontis]|uniref:histidine kinase N-terminal 7TM domain-containing diguanylate cyclase n=1 Tax=Cohnella caldifontis TaxID=3027471 RepID=UPI0023EBFF68|nr:diguanylate cyclase [Cohnella sp. YIM B05605]
MALVWPDMLLFACLLLLFFGVLAFNRISHTHKVYLVFHFVMMIWPFGQFMTSTTGYPGFQLGFVKLSFTALSLLGPGWLFFVLFLTGRAVSLKPYKAFLYLLPSLVCAAGVIFNPRGVFLSPVGGSYLHREYGPLFWLLVVAEYVYFIIALLIMFNALKTVNSMNKRKQLAIAVIGIFVLTGFSVLDLLINVLLAPWLPVIPGLTSLGIFLSDCCFVFAIYRFGMFDILSVAQRDILSHMAMGIIVVDEEDKVLEVNRGASPFLRTAQGEIFDLGKFLSALQTQEETNEFLYKYRHNPQERMQTEIKLQDPSVRHVTIQISPVLDDRKTLIGRVIAFHDVTELRKLVDEMNRKNEALHERNLELIKIQEELFRVNQKLEQMAITDSLTGCYNRRYLMQQLEHEVLLNMRYRIPFSVFLFDIDHFKQINDRYGHLVGDEVIRGTAETVRGKLRRTDILARYGGEEFTVYLPHTNREQAMLLAERILHAIQQNAVEAGDENVNVTISMGVVSEDGDDLKFEDPKEFLREVFARADAALYQAKNGGRNRVVVAH